MRCKKLYREFCLVAVWLLCLTDVRSDTMKGANASEGCRCAV